MDQRTAVHRPAPTLGALLLVCLAGCGQGPDLGPGAEPGPPAALAFESAPEAAVAGTALDPVVVGVRDEHGNPIPNAPAEIVLRLNRGTLEGVVSAPVVNGRAAFTDLRIARADTGYVLVATSEGLPEVWSAPFTVLPGRVDPARSTLAVSPDAVATGEHSVVTVTARDASGNPLAGLPVRLATGGAGAAVVQPPPTDVGGTARGSVRFSVAGTDTITAEVGGVSLSQPTTLVVTGPPIVGAITVSPGDAGLLVGQAASLAASVFDDQGGAIEADVTWASSAPAVAEVSASGQVAALSPGEATITASSGGVTGSARVAVSYGEGTLTGLVYCTMDGVADRMDVYVPSASTPRPLPVAVHVHGGGWTSGRRSTGKRFLALKPVLLERGYLVVSVDYRLGPTYRFPAQIEDLKCAIRHLRAHASRYGLDPERIGAFGGSAGGQLIALLGTADGGAGFDDAGEFQGISSRVQAVAAVSPITDFTHPEELRDDYSRAFLTWPDPTSPEMIRASPVTHVSGDDSPFFFAVGTEDTLVLPAQSIRMDARLRDAGVPSSVLTVLHGDHTLEPTTAPIEPTFEEIIARTADFLDRYLR